METVVEKGKAIKTILELIWVDAVKWGPSTPVDCEAVQSWLGKKVDEILTLTGGEKTE